MSTLCKLRNAILQILMMSFDVPFRGCFSPIFKLLNVLRGNIWRPYLYSFTFWNFWFRRNYLITNCYLFPPFLHLLVSIGFSVRTLSSLGWYQVIFIHTVDSVGRSWPRVILSVPGGRSWKALKSNEETEVKGQ